MTKTIAKLERLPNSVNGNPRYRVWFTDDTVATTEPDAMLAFEISPAWEGRTVQVTFQDRKKPGPLVIADIR